MTSLQSADIWVFDLWTVLCFMAYIPTFQSYIRKWGKHIQSIYSNWQPYSMHCSGQYSSKLFKTRKSEPGGHSITSRICRRMKFGMSMKILWCKKRWRILLMIDLYIISWLLDVTMVSDTNIFKQGNTCFQNQNQTLVEYEILNCPWHEGYVNKGWPEGISYESLYSGH